MRKLKQGLLMMVVVLAGCAPKISDDPQKIGKAEEEAYRFLLDKLTMDMKKKFEGNMYESEKITPRELKDMVKIEIPNGVGYGFKNGNTKYIKGDLNNDKLTDLVICADMTEGYAPENMKYFVFLQKEDSYRYFSEFKADDIVARFCSRMKFDRGLFTLKSIQNGLMVGESKFHAGNEDYFRDYSYSFETEKYRLNFKTQEIQFVSHSDLLKNNDKTGLKEKVDTTTIVARY